MWDTRDITHYFSSYAVKSENNTDFLVGVYGQNQTNLIKIVGDKITEEQIAWIGDIDGFSDLQRNLISNADIELEKNHSQLLMFANTFERSTSNSVFNEINKTYRGFLNVINGTTCKTVSGIVTIACTSNIGFRYSEYQSISGPAVPATSGNGGVYFGDESTGSFIFSSGRELNCPILPVVYQVGKIAVIYAPTTSFIPMIQKYENKKDFEKVFSDKVTITAREIDLMYERVVKGKS